MRDGRKGGMGERPATKAERKRLAKARKAAERANDREFARAQRKLASQEIKAATRAKYGPSGRPAPVVIKNMAGEVIDIRQPRAPRSKKRKTPDPARTAHSRLDREFDERLGRDVLDGAT